MIFENKVKGIKDIMEKYGESDYINYLKDGFNYYIGCYDFTSNNYNNNEFKQCLDEALESGDIIDILSHKEAYALIGGYDLSTHDAYIDAMGVLLEHVDDAQAF